MLFSPFKKIAIFLKTCVLFKKVKSEKMKTLTKIYYTESSQIYETIYQSRYNAPTAQHFPISIQQYNRPKAYPAFFYYTNSMMLTLEQLYKSYENFLYTVNHVPPVVRHQFALLSILDEVKSTNDIEGVHSTRKEIREILDGNAPHTERLHSIVNKYRELLNKEQISFATCQDIRSFYDEFAHDEITLENPSHHLDGYLFRKEPVEIDSPTGKVLHQGLYPEEKILETMQHALDILHSDALPLWVRLGLFHYFFAYIHPFYDGNGRTDRFITSYFMQKEFHPLIGIRLSVYIKKNRAKYYKLFEEADSEINRGDMTPFVTGFLQILLGTINDTIGLLSRKNEQLERMKEQIHSWYAKDETLQDMYYLLLQATLFYGQGIRIMDIAKIMKKTRPTIQKRLNTIPKEHLILTKKQNTIFYKLNPLIFKETTAKV